MTQSPNAAQARRRRAAALAIVSLLLIVAYLATRGSASSSRASRASTTSTRRRVVAKSTPSSVVVPPSIANVYAAQNVVQTLIGQDLNRVYVPSGLADSVSVIDPVTKQVVSQFETGRASTPQHLIPSFDLKTLWVLLNKSDAVVPINAKTGAVGASIPVNDPYNMYFTPDGSAAIVVAELYARLDFRDPHTMALQQSLEIPGCRGLNHADYSADLKTMLLTCEFAGTVAKVDIVHRRVIGRLALRPPSGQAAVMTEMPDHSMASSMPQDVRLTPDATKFYVADMLLGGVHVIDAGRLREIGFIPTGVGAHSVTPSHDGTVMYVANRGSTSTHGPPHGPGSVSVVDPKTDQVLATWAIPGGGSPDMGNLTADGSELWLSGRFDHEVYVFDTTTGGLKTRIKVPRGPHGLTVWPLPGRFSLGHTGNMR